MHITKLLHILGMSQHVEVVIACLPEVTVWCGAGGPGKISDEVIIIGFGRVARVNTLRY